jgi:hypothetical protein
MHSRELLLATAPGRKSPERKSRAAENDLQNDAVEAILSSSAPEEIRTPDPQIRRLLRVVVSKELFCKTGYFVTD